MGVFEVPQLFSSCQTDVDRGTTTVKTTVEQRNGWVVTTTTKIQRIHPDCWADHLAQAQREVDSEFPSTPRITPCTVLTQLPVGGNVEPTRYVTSHNTGDSVNTDPSVSSEHPPNDFASTIDTDDLASVLGHSDVPDSSVNFPAGNSPLASNSAAANLFNGVVNPSAIRRPVHVDAASKFYVVFVGRQVGIVRDNWALVQRLISGVSGRMSTKI
ncbi:hypothetical protein V5O48_018502 [Marasmius crinis-equi]|uniref:Ribonuclease H1 N-terminal domain-containing protein n=1 Tax=Marasmius crinis-equi TaxID=585013 RepID=A0ABR3EL16_9AGAR